MRINRFVALSTGMSRRAADNAIADQRVYINGTLATPGIDTKDNDTITLDNHIITPPINTTILLNKPVGYVCSRNGQGSKTIYDLLPEKLHNLKPVGRLDKDSSGLLLLTNDGTLAQELTHPSRQKIKIYETELNKDLQPLHRQLIQDFGVQLEDGPSKFSIERMDEENEKNWRITMHEGRNRQIRRTFSSLGYTVTQLHRTTFGSFILQELKLGNYASCGTAVKTAGGN
jgi:23S rRNA pseudouridine2605 synthase